MGLSETSLHHALNRLACTDLAFARALEAVGHPPPRIAPPGYPTLLRIILGQQVSVASADATWAKLHSTIGNAADPAALIAASDEALRTAGLSRQKAAYARSLATLIAAGTLDLHHLPEDDEAAITTLISIKGIGRWSAEIYLLFSESRPDIWPAGDLAVQIAIGQIIGLPTRPSEAALRQLAEPWRPHRGGAAILAWHHYSVRTRTGKTAMPV